MGVSPVSAPPIRPTSLHRPPSPLPPPFQAIASVVGMAEAVNQMVREAESRVRLMEVRRSLYFILYQEPRAPPGSAPLFILYTLYVIKSRVRLMAARRSARTAPSGSALYPARCQATCADSTRTDSRAGLTLHPRAALPRAALT